MRILVASASGTNGDGYGSVLSFSPAGELTGPFASDLRGLRFGPDSRLYGVGEDHVVAFDFATGGFAGPVVHLPG